MKQINKPKTKEEKMKQINKPKTNDLTESIVKKIKEPVNQMRHFVLLTSVLCLNSVALSVNAETPYKQPTATSQGSSEENVYNTKDYKFRTQIKDQCYGHIKGVITFGKKNLICYNKDLSTWPRSFRRYDQFLTEIKFGCPEKFARGIVTVPKQLLCLNLEKVGNFYRTEREFSCSKKFVEGITDVFGTLICWRESYLEGIDSYLTGSSCKEGFVRGVIDMDGNLTCWNLRYLETQDSYQTEVKFGCLKELFVAGQINLFGFGSLECLRNKIQ